MARVSPRPGALPRPFPRPEPLAMTKGCDRCIRELSEMAYISFRQPLWLAPPRMNSFPLCSRADGRGRVGLGKGRRGNRLNRLNRLSPNTWAAGLG